MQAIGFIVYIVVGLFQLAAIMAGLESWWGLHWIIAAPHCFHRELYSICWSDCWYGWRCGCMAVGVVAGRPSLLWWDHLCYCLRWNVIVFRMAIIQKKRRDMSQAAFAALFFNECHRRPGGNPQNAHRSWSRQRQYRCRADNDRQRPELKLPETTKRTVQQMLFSL